MRPVRALLEAKQGAVWRTYSGVTRRRRFYKSGIGILGVYKVSKQSSQSIVRGLNNKVPLDNFKATATLYDQLSQHPFRE